MIVLGLDPGIARLGYGVISVNRGKEKCLAFGVIETARGDEGRRLVKLHSELRQLIKFHRPARVCIERLFFSKNTKTATAVGEARGVVLFTCASVNIPIIETSPQTVKQVVSGYGNADKKQVQQMVKILLDLEQIPQPDDAADALAIALCGARIPPGGTYGHHIMNPR